MNLLDLIIILAALAYGFGGFRSGAIVGVFSLIGFFGGAALGARLARPLGSHLVDGRAQVPVAICCVLVLATIGQLLGVYLAGLVRSRVALQEHVRTWDSIVGALLGVLSVLLVAWMVAVPLARSPYPRLASESSHSQIVRWVNSAVPDSFRNLYKSLRQYLDRSGFPPVFGDLPATSIVAVAPPPADLTPAVAAQVSKAQRSIFKIYGQAPECSRAIEGSGFVFAPHHILTNAHVVAGTREVQIQVNDHDSLPANVVLYDPRRDVAVLDVPQLTAPVLQFDGSDAKTGDPALVLGYPENGPFTIRTARVRSKTTVSGNDIYGDGNVERTIYSIRAVVKAGNSGGPLLGDNGEVLGMVFATALDSSDTGFVLANDEIESDAQQGQTLTSPVDTQSCTSD